MSKFTAFEAHLIKEGISLAANKLRNNIREENRTGITSVITEKEINDSVISALSKLKEYTIE